MLCVLFIGLQSGQAQSKKELYQSKHAKEAPKQAEEVKEEVRTAPPTTVGEKAPTPPPAPEASEVQPAQPAQPAAPSKPALEEKKPMEGEVKGENDERVQEKAMKKKLRKKSSNAKK